jgi:hypothetical protein
MQRLTLCLALVLIAASPPEPTLSVLAAAARLMPGHVLTSADVTMIVVARNAGTGDMIQAPDDGAIGGIVLRAIGAREVIRREDVLLHGDPGFDLPVVTPGAAR